MQSLMARWESLIGLKVKKKLMKLLIIKKRLDESHKAQIKTLEVLEKQLKNHPSLLKQIN